MLSTLAIVGSLIAFAKAIPVPGDPVNIQSTLGPDATRGCISAMSGETNGSPVTLESCERTFPSTFTWTVPNSPGPSDIVIFGGMCLDVPNGETDNGVFLQIWECTGGPNQKFMFDSNGAIEFVGNTASGTGKCLDLTNGDLTQGTPIQLWDCIGDNSNQKWLALPEALIEVNIHWNTNSSFCIAAPTNADGAEVVIAPCNGTDPAQLWFVPASGLSQIQIYGLNKCLDVTDGINADGTLLQIFTCGAIGGNPNQIFATKDTGNGQVIEWKENSGKCVDLTGGSTAAGNRLQIWDCISGNTNQLWFHAPDF